MTIIISGFPLSACGNDNNNLWIPAGVYPRENGGGNDTKTKLFQKPQDFSLTKMSLHNKIFTHCANNNLMVALGYRLGRGS
jgi:hypothetical protein